MARQKFSYRNPDGSLKILKVIERMPDGTRIFEDGSRAAPSTATIAGGAEKRLVDMNTGEYEAWNEGMMIRLGCDMTNFLCNNPDLR